MSHCKKNVVGIATVYGMGGPGFDSQWEWDFSCQSVPSPRHAQPTVQWAAASSHEQRRPGREIDHIIPF